MLGCIAPMSSVSENKMREMSDMRVSGNTPALAANHFPADQARPDASFRSFSTDSSRMPLLSMALSAAPLSFPRPALDNLDDDTLMPRPQTFSARLSCNLLLANAALRAFSLPSCMSC